MAKKKAVKKEKPVEKIYKEFNTVEEVLNEEFCNQAIRDNMHDVILKRRALGKEHEIKRGAYNYLNENDRWNLEKMKSEFIEIWDKRSKLPGSVRDYIIAIVNPAVEKTILYYEKEEQK